MSDHKGKEPHVLYCDAHKGNSQAFRDGYDRTFGKKPMPHGKKDNGDETRCCPACSGDGGLHRNTSDCCYYQTKDKVFKVRASQYPTIEGTP